MSTRQARDRELVADKVHSAAIHLLRRVRRSDASFQVSPTGLSALSVLVFSGDKTLGGLAQAEQVRPPTMTKVVQGLEAMGLVERAPDVRDKRVIRLKATAQGRRILRKGRRLRVRTLAELMRTLTVEEIAVLSKAAHLLEKIVTK